MRASPCAKSTTLRAWHCSMRESGRGPCVTTGLCLHLMAYRAAYSTALDTLEIAASDGLTLHCASNDDATSRCGAQFDDSTCWHTLCLMTVTGLGLHYNQTAEAACVAPTHRLERVHLCDHETSIELIGPTNGGFWGQKHCGEAPSLLPRSPHACRTTDPR